MIFDMRVTDFSAPRSEMFSAALDMAEWADQAGFDVLGLGEHHSSDDGYNPSPLILASAFAARTQSIKMRTAMLLAPVPEQPVPILLRGAARAVARAAAHQADGFIVPLMSEDIWQPYREECLCLNKPDPGEYPRQGPTFLWISETTVPSTSLPCLVVLRQTKAGRCCTCLNNKCCRTSLVEKYRVGVFHQRDRYNYRVFIRGDCEHFKVSFSRPVLMLREIW